MLSQSAFNAFLKTLEEPPPYAVFILATTEKHKIIPTILSRCQIFDFKRIEVKDIASHLRHICALEGIEAEQEALIVIAQKADGALRDALSIFDRIASLSENTITYKDVVSNLNILDYDSYFAMVDAFIRGDVSSVLLGFDEILKNGFQEDVFINGLASHYRDLLVSKKPSTAVLLDHSEALTLRYLEQAQLLDLSNIFTALNLINECDVSFPRAKNKRLHVEITLAKICFIARTIEIPAFPLKEAEEKKTADLKERTSDEASPPVEAAIDQAKSIIPSKKVIEKEKKSPEKPKNGVSAKPQTDELDKTQSSSEPEVKNDTVLINTPQLNTLSSLHSQVQEAEQLAKANSVELTLQNVLDFWQEHCTMTQSPSVTATLKAAELALEGKRVIITVGTPIAKSRIQEESDLLPTLRNKFHDPELSIEIKVDAAMDQLAELKKPKKLLTNKEKYEILCEKNPLMKELRSKLDLIVDHDE
jgi:DNA polymerase-3 subunit gamma/tau